MSEKSFENVPHHVRAPKMSFSPCWSQKMCKKCLSRNRPETDPEIRRFRKGVGGRGLATNKPPKRAQKVLQKSVPILLRGHRKKRVQKRGQNFWPLKGFFAPTPSVRQPLFETSETWSEIKLSGVGRPRGVVGVGVAREKENHSTLAP